MDTVSRLASVATMGSIFSAWVSIIACYLMIAPSLVEYLTYGFMSSIVILIIDGQCALFSIAPALLIYSFASLKIYQVRLIKRLPVAYLKRNDWDNMMLISIQERQTESMLNMRGLTALKGVMCSFEAADRAVWGKVYAAYLGVWFPAFGRAFFVVVLTSDQPFIIRIMFLCFLSLMYPAIMPSLDVAGRFVKECRTFIPLMTRLSYAWPRVSSKAKGQLLILELVDRITNRQRGIGFRIGGLTSPITKLITVKATFQFARGFLLIVKKFHHTFH